MDKVEEEIQMSEWKHELDREWEEREKRERNEFLWRIALLILLIFAAIFFFRVGFFFVSGEITGFIIFLATRALPRRY